MHVAISKIHERTIALAVDRLWEVELPAKAEVQGQVLGNAPGVLPVEEGSLLEFLGIG